MKQTLICTILLVLVAGLFALQIGLKGERYAQEGIEFYQRGEFQKALGKFISADRSAGGKVPEYHYWLGKLNIAIADTASAMNWFAKYSASGDLQYKAQVDSYLRIVQRQSLIFNKVNIRPLPDYVNSRNSDYGAVPDPEGKYLYFTSLRPAPKEKENIWRAEIFKSGYGKPEFVSELSTDKNEAFGCFSFDQKGAWIFGNYEKNKRDGDIYYVSREGMSAPPENFAKINSSQVETHPMIFRDRLLFFASSRPGGYGGMDIYVSEKFGGVWTEPQNLGPVVNTADNEQTPFLDYDGRTLFFASRGHAGFGGYDIFKVYRIGNSWQDWSIPENLGLPINSPQNDRYFYHTLGSNEGFISSDRSVSGFEKIYQLVFEYHTPSSYLVQDGSGKINSIEIIPVKPAAKKKVDADTILSKLEQSLDVVKLGLPDRTFYPILPENRTEITDEMVASKPYRPIQFSGMVSDQNGNPVSAEVVITCNIDGEQVREIIATNEQGNYAGTIAEAQSYSLMVNAIGYLLYSQEVKPVSNQNTIALNITLQKLDKRNPPVFPNVLFDFESSQLDAAARANLDNVVITLLNNPDLKVKISGHAFDGSAKSFNSDISERRAVAVADYLLSKGIAKKRLSWKSYSNTKPLEGLTTDYEKAKNRRVEIEPVS